MPLTPCPDCGNRCSPSATSCPKCGHPFREGELAVRQAAANKAKAELNAILNKRTPASRATGLVIGGGGILVGVVMCMTGVGVVCGLPVLLIGLVLLAPSLQGVRIGGASPPYALKGSCPNCGKQFSGDKDSYEARCPACKKLLTV